MKDESPALNKSSKCEHKDEWPPGEWHDERDLVEWTDEATGYSCLITRHPNMGHLCGYVGITKDHPLYGKDYKFKIPVNDEIMQREVEMERFPAMEAFLYACQEDRGEMELSLAVNVHGGVTFSGKVEGGNLWWFGFDCAHSHDLQPGMINFHKEHGLNFSFFGHVEYRNIAYVTKEVEDMAVQLKGFELARKTKGEGEINGL